LESQQKTRSEAEIRQGALDLAKARGRPCLVAAIPHLRRGDLGRFCEAVAELQGRSADVALSQPRRRHLLGIRDGAGCRRRFDELAVFVPLCAKSAATLIALAADDLVLGPLGELGPLDAQFDRKRRADFSSNCSELAVFRAFEQLESIALGLFDEAVGRIVKGSGMTPFDAASKASELVGTLVGPIYRQLDPLRVAEAARSLEVAGEYGARLLRRYRPELDAAHARSLLGRLVHAYPSHGFPLDLEELDDIGLPARAPSDAEAEAMWRIAQALLAVEGELELVEVVMPAEAPRAAAGEAPTDLSPLALAQPDAA
jgi:hypothetical protein